LYKPDLDSEMSTAQKEVLSLIKKIPVTSTIYGSIIQELLIYLSFVIGYEYKSTIGSKAELDSRFTSKNLEKSYIPLSLEVIQDIVASIKQVNSSMVTEVLGDVVKVIGAAMMTKFTAYPSSLWRSAVDSFITIIGIGLPALNRSDLDDLQNNILWTEMADCIHIFLFTDERDKLPYISPDIVQRDDLIDISLVDVLAHQMLGQSAKVSKLHERLIDILMEGTILNSNQREDFAVGCYRNLFYLCGKDDSKSDIYACDLNIARIVVPLLLKKCRDVLQKFISEEKKSGTLPAPRARLAEISFMLKQLREVEIHPDVDVDTSTTKPLPSSILHGRKRHLLTLFPLLCDCITTREATLKELLKDLFHEAAKELGLE